VEECLELDPTGVSKAVSLFGLSNRKNYKPGLSVLCILGENDPKVNYMQRSKILTNADNKNISIIGYDNEGHWFRRKRNIKDALANIIHFLIS